MVGQYIIPRILIRRSFTIGDAVNTKKDLQSRCQYADQADHTEAPTLKHMSSITRENLEVWSSGTTEAVEELAAS